MDDRDGVRGIVGRGATNHRAGVLLIPQNYNSAAADAESGSSCKVGDLSPPSLPPFLAPGRALFDGQGPSDGDEALPSLPARTTACSARAPCLSKCQFSCPKELAEWGRTDDCQ